MPPKQSSRKRAASDEYEADGGFVEDAPKSKKTKPSAGETKSKGGAKKEDSGNEYWELGRTRRVQINEFKGKQLVDIREFYEKEEQMLPGKKGVSLNIEQFTSLIEQLPEIEKVLKAKGIAIPRPTYGGVSVSSRTEEEEEEEEEEDVEEPEKKADAAEESEDEEPVKPAAASKLDRFKHKANHEATSDEDN